MAVTSNSEFFARLVNLQGSAGNGYPNVIGTYPSYQLQYLAPVINNWRLSITGTSIRWIPVTAVQHTIALSGTDPVIQYPILPHGTKYVFMSVDTFGNIYWWAGTYSIVNITQLQRNDTLSGVYRGAFSGMNMQSLSTAQYDTKRDSIDSKLRLEGESPPATPYQRNPAEQVVARFLSLVPEIFVELEKYNFVA